VEQQAQGRLLVMSGWLPGWVEQQTHGRLLVVAG